MSSIATGPRVADERINADQLVVARLERQMESHRQSSYVAIAQVMTSVTTGESYMTSNIGQFTDRFSALAFMDANPDMFAPADTPTARWTYALVYVEDVERRSITVL